MTYLVPAVHSGNVLQPGKDDLLGASCSLWECATAR